MSLRALLFAGPAPERVLGRFALLFFLALVLRSAAIPFGILDIDEAHWSVIGRLIVEGATPYVDFADHKPPLLFYLFALFRLLTGGSLLLQALVVVAIVAATATLLCSIARRLGATPLGAFATGWVYVALTSCSVITANAELLSDLPVAAALYFAAGERFSPGRLAVAGLFAGVAALVRPQAAIVGIAIVLVCLLQVVWLRRAREGIVVAAMFALGVAMPVGVTVGAFAAADLLVPLWEWNVTRNLGYPAPTGWVSIMLVQVAVFFVVAQGWAFALGLQPMALSLRRLRARDGALHPLSLVIAFLLPLALLAVCAGKRFYPHYFIQLALPLAVLSGPRLAAGLERLRARTGAPGRFRLALALLLVPVLGFMGVHWGRAVAGRLPGQDPKVAAIAAFLRSPAAPAGPVAVWGDQSHLYLDADRRPASRFYNAAPLVGNFDSNHVGDDFDVGAHARAGDIATFIADLERNRAALLIDTSSGAGLHQWHRFALQRVAALWSYVQRTYVRIATIAGAEIYARKP